MITANDIAQLARDLNLPTANEARIRCSVSRAYYAAYHYCDQAANTWCNPLPEAEKKDRPTHAQLYLRLEKFSKDKVTEKELQAMAKEAKNLRLLRVKADYNLTDSLDQKTVTRSLSYMSQVKSYLDSIIKATTAATTTKTDDSTT